MHFDYVTVRIVEEDLVPTVHGPRAIVRIRHPLLVETLLESSNVVGPEGDMSALQRINELLLAEPECEVSLRHVHLDVPIRRECRFDRRSGDHLDEKLETVSAGQN